MSTLEERVAALEQQVREQSTLRAAQDGDLSTVTAGLRAANNLLQALALTQSDQTAVLGEHTAVLGEIKAEMRAGFGALTTLLTTLIEQGETGEGV